MGSNGQTNLEKVLAKAGDGISLDGEEILYLLNLSDVEEVRQVFERARSLRKRHFGDKVFLYGFLYFSTYCRNDCNFCMYRFSNKGFDRYRKSPEAILESAHQLVESGVHLLDLTMGEDPAYHAKGGKGFQSLFKTVKAIKESTSVPLMISPGVISEEILKEFKNLGVDWYACYQETYNQKLYSALRTGQDFEERLESKRMAHQIGMLIEEGILTGVGDTPQDVVASLEGMKKLNAEQVRVMSFVSQKGTPMHPWPAVPRMRELLIIAIMRIIFPDKLIPASLDVDGLSGLTDRINAGANVVTSIIPPMAGLSGVSQSSLDIDDGNRTVKSIIPVLEDCQMTVAAKEDYVNWVDKRKLQL